MLVRLILGFVWFFALVISPLSRDLVSSMQRPASGMTDVVIKL